MFVYDTSMSVRTVTINDSAYSAVGLDKADYEGKYLLVGRAVHENDVGSFY